MTEDALWLLVCFALVFAINLVPAFMPSTWMLLSFFYIKFDPPLLPLTLGGALVSGLGRIALARGSTWVKRRFMASKQADLDELGAFLDERRQYVGATVFVASDTILSVNRFVRPVPHARLALMVTYQVGQALIVVGVLSATGG